MATVGHKDADGVNDLWRSQRYDVTDELSVSCWVVF